MFENLNLFLENIDRNIFFLINNFNNPYLDQLMYLISDKYIWIPLYIILIYYVINQKIDGNFPAHHPDPTVPKNLKQLIGLQKC